MVAGWLRLLFCSLASSVVHKSSWEEENGKFELIVPRLRTEFFTNAVQAARELPAETFEALGGYSESSTPEVVMRT